MLTGGPEARREYVAKKVIEELVDDLDGTTAARTVRIGWNDEWRELELSEKNLATFSKSFDKFWDAARPTSSSPSSSSRGKPKARNAKRNGSTTDYNRDDFRTWAVENDVKLNRGRPPRELVERFLASQT